MGNWSDGENAYPVVLPRPPSFARSIGRDFQPTTSSISRRPMRRHSWRRTMHLGFHDMRTSKHPKAHAGGGFGCSYLMLICERSQSAKMFIKRSHWIFDGKPSSD